MDLPPLVTLPDQENIAERGERHFHDVKVYFGNGVTASEQKTSFGDRFPFPMSPKLVLCLFLIPKTSSPFFSIPITSLLYIHLHKNPQTRQSKKKTIKYQDKKQPAKKTRQEGEREESTVLLKNPLNRRNGTFDLFFFDLAPRRAFL
jgi:hypothetical protein